MNWFSNLYWVLEKKIFEKIKRNTKTEKKYLTTNVEAVWYYLYKKIASCIKRNLVSIKMLFLINVRKNKLSINNVYYLFGEKVKVRSWFCTVSISRDRHKTQNSRKIG